MNKAPNDPAPDAASSRGRRKVLVLYNCDWDTPPGVEPRETPLAPAADDRSAIARSAFDVMGAVAEYG